MDVTITRSSDDLSVIDARNIEITLSNGARVRLRELTMFPGLLNVSADDTLSVLPRSANSFNIRCE